MKALEPPQIQVDHRLNSPSAVVLNPWGRLLPSILLSAGLLLAAGCETTRFLHQAAGGQLDIWRRETSIPTLLARTNTPSELRRRLELVLACRKFAETELQLPAGRSYLAYADLGRPFVSWAVSAAPEFSLDDKEWWFPIVGSVSYRGYFREDMAIRYGAKLAAEGLDVSIGGVAAYSTLGWFADPVLNTFLFDPADEVIDLVFHELTHRWLYVPGDTDFNEALATFVAQEGLRRWFLAHPDPAAEARWKLKERRWAEVRGAVLETRSRLKSLYDQTTPTDIATLRAAKSAEIAHLKARLAELNGQWAGEPDLSGWLHHPINNARLNSVTTYYRLVPAFGVILADRGGDMPAFHAAVKRLSKLPEAERQRRMESLLARAGSPP